MFSSKYSVNRIVLTITLSSLVWAIAYKFWLIKINANITNAYEIGDMFYQLANANIASGVFYYFVVFLNQRRIKNNLSPVLKKRLQNFAISESEIRRRIYRAIHGNVENFNATMEEMDPFLFNIKLEDSPPYHPGQPDFDNWYLFFDYYFSIDQVRLRRLYELSTHLDSEILARLDDIEYSYLELSLDSIRKHRDSKTYSLNGIREVLKSYLQACRDVARMSETHV